MRVVAAAMRASTTWSGMLATGSTSILKVSGAVLLRVLYKFYEGYSQCGSDERRKKMEEEKRSMRSTQVRVESSQGGRNVQIRA